MRGKGKRYPKGFEYIWKGIGSPPPADASRKDAGFLVWERMVDDLLNLAKIVRYSSDDNPSMELGKSMMEKYSKDEK